MRKITECQKFGTLVLRYQGTKTNGSKLDITVAIKGHRINRTREQAEEILILNHTWGPQGTHKCPGVLIFQPHFFWGNKGACANISGFSASSQFCLSADIFGSQQFGELQMLLMFKVHQRPFFSWNGKLKFCSFSCFSHQTINTSAAMLPSNQLSDFACQERLPDAD